MKTTLFICSLLFAIHFLNAQTATAPAGSGTSGNPYQIVTLDNLYWISDQVVNGNGFNEKYFKQMNDIDASSTSTWFADGSGGYYGWLPIGNISGSFNGKYDGQDYAIDGLYVHRTSSDYIGLFGEASLGYVKNLGLTNVNISGKGYVGGLTGIASTQFHITNCYSTGTVTGGSDGTTGGLIGYNYSGIVLNCHSACSVSSSGHYTGGLVGYNANSGDITECYATGTVSSSSGNYFVGGLVGYNTSNGTTISNCYATGAVSGSTDIGGLVGSNDNEADITNCYATGSVSGYAGSTDVGGLAGYHYGSGSTIVNCYSTGPVSGSTNVGGLIGDKYQASVSSSFWDTQTSGQTTSDGGTGKTTAEMKTESTYTNAGWDFIGETTNGTDDYWGINSSYNAGYPFLSFQSFLATVTTQAVTGISGTTATGNGNITDLGYPDPTQHGLCWNITGTPTIADDNTQEGPASATGAFTSAVSGLTVNTLYYFRAYVTNDAGTSYGDEVTFITFPGGGSGTSGDPYQVSTFDELNTISENSFYWDKYFIQTADIDASQTSTMNPDGSGGYYGWAEIGNYTTQFTGSYDGDEHLIANLYSKQADGLFGQISGASISNLGVVDVDLQYHGAGGLVGNSTNGSTIDNCYTTGSVYGNVYVGGLIGTNETGSTISNCYSRASVHADNHSGGGFVGGNSGTINYCYSTGSVYAYTEDEGFCAENLGTITNSFWDTETSGQATSNGGTGKTTAEMKTQGTFTNAGWDFVGESINGTNDYWEITTFTNDGYPILSWQRYPATVTTQAVSDIMAVTATGNGNITDLGYPNPSQHGVCWNTSGLPTIADDKTEDGAVSATGAFTSSITGLDPNTLYYVRAYVTNSAGTSYGEETSFTSHGAPAITTNDVVSITFISALSGGNVTNDYGYAVTARGVCWSTTPNPTTADAYTVDGSGTGTFESIITGLSKNNKYYVRAYATNSTGTGYGNEKSFITPNQIYNMLDFDGANDYVTVPITLPDQGTIEFWFYADDNTTGYLWAGEATYWYSQVANGKIYTWVGGSPGGTIVANGISADKWYHLAVTWVKAGVSVTSQVYLNGNLIGTTNNQWASPGASLTIGKKTSYFNGKMEEFKIWNTVRTSTELRTDMHKFISPSSSNLLCYYNFDISSGTTLPDGTSNGYNGTLINMTNADWVTSTAPAGVYGTYVRTVTQTTAGETGKTISATISSGGNDTDFLGIYTYGEGDATISCETYPAEVTRRSNIIWGVVEFGSVTSDLTFDYSNISGLGVEPQFKLLKRSNAISDWTDVTGSATQNTGNHTFTMTGVTSFSEFTVAEHEFFIDGFAGTCLELDGSGDNIQGTGMETTMTQVTLEAWINHSALGNNIQRYITIQPEIAVLRYDGVSGGGTPKLHFYIKKSSGSLSSVSANNVLPVGEWTHVAGTYDGTDLKLYMNGELVASSSPAGGLYAPNGSFNFSSSGETMNGKLDELRVWSVARSQEQIRESMHIEPAGYINGFVGYWQMNEGNGSQVTDAISGNNANMVNMTNEDWVNSTIPFGYGIADSQTETYGTVDFANTGVSINYSSQNGATVTVSRIDTTANVNPGEYEVLDSQYWVIHRYGTGAFDAFITFTSNEDLTQEDEDSPTRIKLYTRGSTADTSWAFLSDAMEVNAAANEVSFAGITGFSQFILARDTTIIKVTLNLKAFLEGTFNGSDMNTSLNSNLPWTQPYNTEPWNYYGEDGVDLMPWDVVDWVLVELRDAPDAALASSATIIARQAALLFDDGMINDGSSGLSFQVSLAHSLFVVINHRNSISIMSSVPLTETGGVYTYDFTTAQGQAYGNGQADLGNGYYGMYSGDLNADGIINNDDLTLWKAVAGNEADYLMEDANLDRQVDNQDKDDYWLPNIDKSCQVPQ